MTPFDDKPNGVPNSERRKYNVLRRRQIKIETEAWEKTVEEYRKLQREMCEKKLAPSLPYVKSLFLGWFEPLRDAIAKEQILQETEKRKAAYTVPHICLLPADKIAVIVMHKMMGLLMIGHEESCVRVVQAAMCIGEAIEHEVKIHRFLERTKRLQSIKNSKEITNEAAKKEQEILRKHVQELVRKKKLMEVQKLVTSEEDTKSWFPDSRAKLGSRLIGLLAESAYVQPPIDQLADSPPEIRPAFRHTYKTITSDLGSGRKVKRRYGVIQCDQLVHKGLDNTGKIPIESSPEEAIKGSTFLGQINSEEDEVLRDDDTSNEANYMMIPYVPMLIPPKVWKGYDIGGHLFLPSYVMRTHGAQQQQDAIKSTPKKQMGKVFEAMLKFLKTQVSLKAMLKFLKTQVSLKAKMKFLKTQVSLKAKMKFLNTQALDTLGRTKWRVNRRVLGVLERLWARGGNVAGLVDCTEVLIPERPQSEDATEIQKWRWSVVKAKKSNRERHAQRCDIELKLSVAQKLKDEEGFYYPHNLDFRGRAYPMHPHLNHLNSDLCRGILEFAEGRPLGKTGLRWLKIHLANLYGGGVKKLCYEERLTFVKNHLFDILDSAENPIDGKCWWLNAEDPFQCLAACINLSEALKSSSSHTIISYVPIHQDGSCNGLQHYAALGRDSLEAASVNLVTRERPADVYSEIAARVLNIIKLDSEKDLSTDPTALLAKILIDQVDRKLVKQTVMTSVYGVTYVGARDQIKRRLEEKGQITDDRLLFSASCYAAKVSAMLHQVGFLLDWI
ncbi:hypothetical protein GIB67_016848 [Kingdonia uniflora]|uniref:DNA-directed RNA polymerase n=1 Tax=Kingdonia uniflora TaxID=39325 RepID=A0A7J7LQI9_9MAGN|nr:hypothetical protein GIB67_016848 [Kingdonia uniflora]